ncbi:MAG: DUF5107 domain-containing protein [Lachnospiraceae bacterium]
MTSTLQLEEQAFLITDLGSPSSVPPLMIDKQLQSNLIFHLDEDDEIYEGYGTVKNCYPYHSYNTYSDNEETKFLPVAILENQLLKATFLPSLGGRLWSLIDKKTNKNLLYTNDIIKFRNLSTRNAWFSGGVEWNCGIIGHSPFTTDQVFTSSLVSPEGTPILRMYEFERIRKVAYQMDFWLDEQIPLLNCRMRVTNSHETVTPMYWWSNMAVPTPSGGRLIVPGADAYTSTTTDVYKVNIPNVDGVDISHYDTIPYQIDYFFNIPKDSPKYIAQVNASGYGLLHTSSDKLQSRKLFSWGHNKGSRRWQSFLTKHAGPYLEIQAGVGKTQYGCIPMAPHTAWEWVEQYGPIQLDEKEIDDSFDNLQDKVAEQVTKRYAYSDPHILLHSTKKNAKTPASTRFTTGSGYGAWDCKECKRSNPQFRNLSEHLDFNIDRTSGAHEDWAIWEEYRRSGTFPILSADDIPFGFVTEDTQVKDLEKLAFTDFSKNWLVHYLLGVYYLNSERFDHAKTCFLKSLYLMKTKWAYHAMACLGLHENNMVTIVNYANLGMSFGNHDLSYLKEMFTLLVLAKDFQSILEQYDKLSEEFKNDSRLYYYYLRALDEQGNSKEAYERLIANGGLELLDLRECDDALDVFWTSLHGKLFDYDESLPDVFHFQALDTR